MCWGSEGGGGMLAHIWFFFHSNSNPFLQFCEYISLVTLCLLWAHTPTQKKAISQRPKNSKTKCNRNRATEIVWHQRVTGTIRPKRHIRRTLPHATCAQLLELNGAKVWWAEFIYYYFLRRLCTHINRIKFFNFSFDPFKGSTIHDSGR